MRAFLASSIGVATAALALTAIPLADAATPDALDTPPAASPVPGSTQSLPLTPLPDRNSADSATRGGGPALGLPQREVKPFSMLGVVWDGSGPQPEGAIQVRTRARASGDWSGWRDLPTHAGHQPGETRSPADHPLSGRGAEERVGTEPRWVGASDGVQVRVVPGPVHPGSVGRSGPVAALPQGMRVELVQPGDSRGGAPDEARGGAQEPTADHVGPRPGIAIRSKWGADESLREREFLYTGTVKAAFVHHSAGTNDYACSEAPSLIRSMYRYHVQSLGWRDIGYNFLVDKCGQIYEGRAGGVIEPVMGAHTLGFNTNTMGVAVLGSFGSVPPTKEAREGVAKLTAWKLGLFKANPSGTTRLTSGGGKYSKGTVVNFNVISGHRDGYNTECPGARLYGELGGIRSLASRLQGR